MSLKLLIDMNLSVEWAEVLTQAGYPSVHWSTVGDYRADDTVIMEWAKTHGYVVFTHDLDFGKLLAMTQAIGPSVLQIRGRNVLPEQMESLVMTTLQQFKQELVDGALVVVEPRKSRVHVLPISK